MTVQDLVDKGHEDVIVFENPSFDGCIIGISTDDKAVYSLSKMIEWYSKNENCSYDEALEFISYNTIRALPYQGEKSPIVVDDLEE